MESSGQGPMTVFVVDDEHLQQEEMSTLLERVGFRTRAFGSAEALLDELNAQQPACIVTELVLPGMTGLDLTRHLRSRNDLTPVIIVTRQGDVASAVAAFRQRAADFVIRPFVERDLVNRLRAVLEAGKAAKASMNRQMH